MTLVQLLKTIVFGIVEGITEWLPVSSTGHMILLNEFLPLTVGDRPEEFYGVFQVVIQLGAIMAVVVLFWNRIWPFGKKNNRAPLSAGGVGAWIRKDVFVLWFHILVSCVPAAIIGVLFDDKIDELFMNFKTVSVMLILVGIAFLIIEGTHPKAKITKVSGITYRIALIIGLFQVIAAVLPGTSRSGATIIGALLIGVSRTVAVEYTFYLAIPVMLGASLLKIVKFGFAFTAAEAVVLLLGMAVAFAVSVPIIRFILNYIKTHDFKVFGWYRIALGALMLLLGLTGVIG